MLSESRREQNNTDMNSELEGDLVKQLTGVRGQSLRGKGAEEEGHICNHLLESMYSCCLDLHGTLQ